MANRITTPPLAALRVPRHPRAEAAFTRNGRVSRRLNATAFIRPLAQGSGGAEEAGTQLNRGMN
jgi:hypothetical protein